MRVKVYGVGSTSNYKTAKGVNKQRVVAGPADQDSVMKDIVYDAQKLSLKAVGTSIMLHINYVFILEPTPVITSRTRVITTCAMMVSEAAEEAEMVANPPTAVIVSLFLFEPGKASPCESPWALLKAARRPGMNLIKHRRTSHDFFVKFEITLPKIKHFSCSLACSYFSSRLSCIRRYVSVSANLKFSN